MVTVLLLAAGLGLLVLGGELLVRGASNLGRAAGISPVVVGLTVVAGATSAPELAVSLDAALTGSPGLAVGNAVGSSIANVLLVLGVAAIVRYQLAGRGLLHFDLPVALVIATLALVLSLDGELGRPDGALLLLGLVSYVVLAVRRGRRHSREARSQARDVDVPAGPSQVAADVARVVVGVGLLVGGAALVVEGASAIAEALGFSDLVIGLTVVAVGTSLPEVVTSLVAAFKGDRELAVGNVVGSNIFNIGAVLGISSVTIPVPIDPAAVNFDLPVLLAVTVALGVVLFTGAQLSRGEGVLLVGWFAAYTGYLVLDSQGHDALP
ncbi:calcium/sodium antiporter, partial [Nocardioides sp.]|uniref:calcium/sodium antiporter n=1 Tax=Nocardioides sp. TaxID=35761 RepID=UPI002B2761DA